MINYEATILIGITAFVYCIILCADGMILSDLKRKAYLHPMFDHANRMNEGKGIHPVFKVLFVCPMCLAGQLSLWYYVFTTPIYNIINNIFSITISILAAWLLMQLNKKIND